MKKIIFPVLLLLSLSFITGPVFAQDLGGEITITLRDGRVLQINPKSRDSLARNINPSDVESITIMRGNGLSSPPLKSFPINPSNPNRTFLGVKSVKDDDGAKIVDVITGSPAEKAGLLNGDIITRVDDKAIDGPETLGSVIRNMKPDQKVVLGILRDGKKTEISAVLEKDTSPAGSLDIITIPHRNFRFQMPNPFGRGNLDSIISVRPASPKLGIQIQETEAGDGVTVLKVISGSPAETSGLKEGDLITGVNGNKIGNLTDIQKEIRQTRGDEYKLQVLRNKKQLNLTVKIPRPLRKADL